ncbi:MAG: B12-binding domain-containing radical SAM protein [Candidatus Moraniibacteriota bacterium]
MRVLLVYPKYPDTTFWSFKGALEFTGEKAALPPLGFLTIGAMIPRDWETVFVDENIERLTGMHILWADIVFVSGMIVQQESTGRVLKRCRDLGKKTVLGGSMVTADPEQFSGMADSLFLGEAEGLFPSLIEDLRRGIGFVKKEYRSDAFCDIKRSPIPCFDLLGRNMWKYTSMALQWGRGCPYGCEFCNVTTLFGRRMRLKTPDRMKAELKALYSCGWRGTVFFVDDNFIGNPGKAKEVLKSIADFQIERGYPFRFYTQTDIGLAANDELISLMVKAGFFRVFTGIETPEAESLKGANKHHNVDIDVPKAMSRLLQAGIQVQAGFVLGFDQDTRATFGKMIALIQNTGIMTAMVGTLQALPGTVLYHRLKEEGRLLDQSAGDNTDGSVGFVPNNGMSREALESGYRRVVSTIYAPGPYHYRLLRFLGDYRPNPFLRNHLSWGATRAFLLCIVKIGIFSRARKWFWKTLRFAVSTNPKAFPATVEHWIFWFHFDRISSKLAKPGS